MSELRFDDRVVVVTGAGGGLGRTHAKLLAARGAKVVVNDLGGTVSGEGQNASAADAVVADIKAAGGQAVASYDSVEDGDKIIACALDTFGRIDIVINNAGILRDVSFHKMTADDWDAVYRVHVLGAFRVTHAAWPHLRNQGYGRVIMTSSAAGLYGNFGQANYGMAKLGLVGFAHTLAIEGQSKGVHVNTIAPVAGSRMTETILPPDVLKHLGPEYVSPLVAWLAHEDCAETGAVFEVGGGFFAKLQWARSVGETWRIGREITPEAIRQRWPAITQLEKIEQPATVMAAFVPIMENIQRGPSRGGNALIDVDRALEHTFPEHQTSHDESDLALYALGVGAATDPVDQAELRFVYELHGDGFQALPTFGVIPAMNAFVHHTTRGELSTFFNFGPERILHGEHRLELLRPLPVKATLTHRTKIVDIVDKGKHARVDILIESADENGETIMRNTATTMILGAGGWDGERQDRTEATAGPEGAPDAVVSQKIPANQALLYRLCGDRNPLHADPGFAQAVGFERPILHGLCTLGFGARHVLETFGRDRAFKSVSVRMSATTFPGETLITEMHRQDDQRILFRAKVKEREAVVLSHGVIELH